MHSTGFAPSYLLNDVEPFSECASAIPTTGSTGMITFIKESHAILRSVKTSTERAIQISTLQLLDIYLYIYGLSDGMYLLFLSSWATKVEAKQLENSEMQMPVHPAKRPKVTKIGVLDTVGGV